MNINSYEKIEQSSEALRMKGAQKPENSTNYRASITSTCGHTLIFFTQSPKKFICTRHHITFAPQLNPNNTTTRGHALLPYT